jgi:hypothetical protein
MARKSKIVLDSPEVKELAKRIANLLGETDKKALFGISAVIGVNGSQFALQRLVAAAKMKREGITLKTDDGKRYRSFGGCFFKLCKDGMTSSKRYKYMAITDPKTRNGKDRRGDKNGRR